MAPGILLTCEMINGDGQDPDFFLERPEGQRVRQVSNSGVDLIEARTDGRKTGRSLFPRLARGHTGLEFVPAAVEFVPAAIDRADRLLPRRDQDMVG